MKMKQNFLLTATWLDRIKSFITKKFIHFDNNVEQSTNPSDLQLEELRMSCVVFVDCFEMKFA